MEACLVQRSARTHVGGLLVSLAAVCMAASGIGCLRSENNEVSDWRSYNLCGARHFEESGDFDAAVRDFTKAIQLARQAAVSDLELWNMYRNRGLANIEAENYDAAIEDFTAALKFDPGCGLARSGRGRALAAKGLYAAAITEYGEAIENSNSSGPQSALAELLAACPDPRFRDGHLAVALATGAVEVARREIGLVTPLDQQEATYAETLLRLRSTLAAAYAELGEWARAVDIQERALATAREVLGKTATKSVFLGRQVDQMQERLESFTAKRPYRLAASPAGGGPPDGDIGAGSGGAADALNSQLIHPCLTIAARLIAFGHGDAASGVCSAILRRHPDCEDARLLLERAAAVDRQRGESIRPDEKKARTTDHEDTT
jgi:tetratricopeptide (TPR) repeat protein